MNKQLLVIFLVLAAFFYVFNPFAGKCETSVPGIAGREVTGIRFVEQNWQAALNEANAQNKLVFLDAYASWCGPCKQLKRKTFPDKTVADFFNANFINAAIDMEKGEGPSIAARYRVSAYPTLLVVDKTGKVIAYSAGYMNAQELIAFGKFALARNAAK